MTPSTLGFPARWRSQVSTAWHTSSQKMLTCRASREPDEIRWKVMPDGGTMKVKLVSAF